MSNVTALARKPIVRAIPGPDILSELQDAADDETRLISVYLADAGVQIMYCGTGCKFLWEASWSPLTLEEAIECAREQAYERGVDPERNLFYIPQGFDRGESGYLWADVDAGTDCLDIDTLATYQDRGDDCLLCFYDPARRELQKYRVNNGLLEWWHKGRPHTLEGAKHIANRGRQERELTLDQLHFIEVTTPIRDGGGGC
jgi:hypothetical protein